MAIKETSREFCANVGDYKREFYCDTDVDINDLPKCCTGSTAVIVSSGKVMMVNASGTWVEFGADDNGD